MMPLFMLSIIGDWDWDLFVWINSTISNDLFDVLLPWVRNKYIWLPLYTFLIAYFFFSRGKRAWLILFFFLLTAGTTDYITSSHIKPLVHRERPCNDVLRTGKVITRIDCGPGYSFPSSHASNHMGLAVFLLLLFRKVTIWRYLFLFWAFLISFAQVYVGVHYPSDIIAGWILGGIIGLLIYYLLEFYFLYFYGSKSILQEKRKN